MAKPRKIRDTLFRKAFEFCQECNADVSLMVWLKENSQIYIFNSDSRWLPLQEGLGYTNGCKSLHYPVPLRITWQELAAAYQA
ncbi:uncharacterized protein P174DRAFT_509435 [Aspergillus novofumigatus IBT 16806]|uniref:Uncharacterized protein n=1 Tax=Aspergillus novofumigatus (strain IBT 16806) TaxID=1392255 RepID=A0A2I1CPG2_ASPN1|nr:uncharacterized protein P174DRAFT_509435 [Aspergillus novofumigatus IBT 16806]PKX99516.1 hypothetical protein P174DRAFT_509435 [Aspergillus novofumigatus IBT 16806]